MKTESKKNGDVILVSLYVILSLLVVFGEYSHNISLLKLTKPFIIPVLTLLYLQSTKKINKGYLCALVFAWIANLFFIMQTKDFIFNGTVSYLIFWSFITVLILRNTKFPNLIPFAIAVIPFLFAYCCLFHLIFNKIGNNIYLFFLSGFFMVFLGAYSLASYFIESKASNTFLLCSVLLFISLQVLISVDLYYVTSPFFRPMAAIMLVSAQYFLLKTFLAYELDPL
ncbi:MAG TPA: lysoplasmalogenase family protein [Flavobacterium sp.]|uniref:lysoplasmalogenase family protein n=1 Tax=Flavobacterium sp. TaxID=239 RepID=UPI002B7A7B0A|nr:lysoplasmalogenase family protein [Flavobacterium sp.]HSD13986.1 lysoplasmalogenase family protein [Flavobacterium sp.]